MSYIFNPFTGTLDYTDKSVSEVATDPVSPNAGDTWVLKTGSGGSGGGKPYGFYPLTITHPNTGGAITYQFSFRTIAGTTKRVTLT